MTNEVDEFLGDLKETENDPFKSETEDPLAQPEKEEKKPEEKDEKEEEKLPFHKDPKVQRFIEKEIERRMPKETIIEKEVVSKDEEDPLLDVLTRVIGNDTPEKVSAIKDFQKALESREERIRQAALDELNARENEEKEAEIQAQNELVEGFENIEDTFNVDITSNNPQAQKTRSEFIDFIKRVAPKDREGQVTEFPDLEETFRLFQSIKKESNPTSNRAKELAARSTTRSSDASITPQSSDKSWNAVEKWFNKLTG